jgi:hypothetical protein
MMSFWRVLSEACHKRKPSSRTGRKVLIQAQGRNGQSGALLAVDVLPKNYASNCSRALKERIRAAQLRAAIAVNHELVTLYWHIGKDDP